MRQLLLQLHVFLQNSFKAQWENKNSSLKANVELNSTLESLKVVEFGIDLVYRKSDVEDPKLDVYLKHHPNKNYILVGSLKNDQVIVDINTPLEYAKKLHFTGQVKKQDDNRFFIEGDLQNVESDVVYRPTVMVSVPNEEQPFEEFSIEIVPSQQDGNPLTLKLNLKEQKLSFSAVSDWVNGNAGLTYADYLNWDLKTRFDKTEWWDQYVLDVSLSVQESGNTSVFVLCETASEYFLFIYKTYSVLDNILKPIIHSNHSMIIQQDNLI